jgi:hypothetical protein
MLRTLCSYGGPALRTKVPSCQSGGPRQGRKIAVTTATAESATALSGSVPMAPTGSLKRPF